MKPTVIMFKNKKIMFLRKNEGEYKLKKWDKEQKRVVETNELHHWKLQTFSIELGTSGRTKLGFINVEYWGEKELKEGMYIDYGNFYLKQKKWSKKDPHTFIEKKMSEIILVMVDFNKLVEEKDSLKKYDKNRNLTPEQSAKLGMEEYLNDKYSTDQKLAIEDTQDETLVEVNDCFKVEPFDFDNKENK